MFKLKIFLKISAKKLKKLSIFKNKSLKTLFYFLTTERNKHYDIIKKYLIVFMFYIKTKAKDDIIENSIMDSLFINTIECLNAKSLKRLNIRAKGKADLIKKQNAYLVLTIKQHKETNSSSFCKKNYLIKYYGKKN